MSTLLLATSLCQTLVDAGYIAYFAGGWVRDKLLGRVAEEIDIATSAPPDIVQQCFPYTIPIGVSFGVVLVRLESTSFEVATFRQDLPYHDGRHPEGVSFSTPKEDALRRDFTINGMFYDPLTDTLYDYVGGQQDLEKRVVRAIGDPHSRFTEDRLRMLRAVRFAAQLHFEIERHTAEAIQLLATTLSVSRERIWQELEKMAHAGGMAHTLEELHRLHLLCTLFPELTDVEGGLARAALLPDPFPLVGYLLALLPPLSPEAGLAWCKAWKLSRATRERVAFLTTSIAWLSRLSDTMTPSTEKEHEEVGEQGKQWAHFYAHEDAEYALHLYAASLSPSARAAFWKENEARRHRLGEAIHRIVLQQPLVSAELLMQQGIPPGKTLGLLLQKAEALAIAYDLHTPEEVLSHLFREKPKK